MPKAEPDPDKIRQKIQFLRAALRQLREIGSRPESEFLTDDILQAAAVRNLQIGVEAILDTANHIVARLGLGLPATYQEAIALLIKEGILPREKAENFAGMVRFRNRAVHLYEEIDPAEVWKILQEHLGDFEVFIRAMTVRYF